MTAVSASGTRDWRPRYPRSIRNRLAIGSLLVTAAAIVSVYLYVVPQLRTRLQDQKLQALVVAAQHYTAPVLSLVGTSANERVVNDAVRAAAANAGARVTLLGTSNGTEGLSVFVLSDSTREAQPEPERDALALRAARSGQVQLATVRTPNGGLAEAARPLYLGRELADVIVYASPLADIPGNVAAVRQQILVAGGIALILAALIGYGGARALSGRIGRLETAAREVAAGDFSHPIPVDSDDELGQLAVAFNDMQRQLAQLDSARKQFIATASHELRTPLFSLGGFVELLSDEELDEATHDRFLVQIRAQIDRLTKLATELFDLSRLDAGSLELRPESVNVGQLARTVTAEFVPALVQHASELELRLRREPIEAICDPERVAQIMRILIDNAITHTPSGTPIRVTATRENGALQLSVQDTGDGIRGGALDTIFEPFFTSNDAQGSGLGLAIARELAAWMQGTLSVELGPGPDDVHAGAPAR